MPAHPNRTDTTYGGTVTHPTVLSPPVTAPAPEVTLTPRELQVLGGMSRGLSNREIGVELWLTEDTVKTHCRRLYRKLQARDRAHAVALGMRARIIQ